jgi:CCR4-NOT transcription complex subunit 6
MYYINNDNLVPNHCANFFFNGVHKNDNNINGLDIDSESNKSNGIKLNGKNNNLSNNNMGDKNGDYASPTFNLKLKYNNNDKNNNIKTIETIKDKDKENKTDNETVNKSEEKQKNNKENLKQKEPSSNMTSSFLKLVHENSNGLTIEVNDKNKKIINKNNKANNMNIHNIVNHKNNNINSKNYKQQEKNLSIIVNSNLNSKANINSKAIKENEIITSNIHKNSSNSNNINSNLNSNKPRMKKNNVLLSNQTKINIQNKNMIKEDISNYNNNNNYNCNAQKNVNANINNQNNIANACEKCNQIIVCKKNQNSRYKHPNIDSLNYNIKNLYTSVNESDRKKKKLSVSHNKSKSGTGSLIKFHAHDNNIFNIKSGNFKGKKFKSISPTLQHRNFNDVIKEKNKMKGKSQSKSKSKNKNSCKNDINDINTLCNKGKYNSNTNKQKSIKEKMDMILSKNILALTKKIRKSPSPKLRVVKPSLLRNIIYNQKDKVENAKHNNNFGNNIICNGLISRKNKNSPSPLSFRFANNNSNLNDKGEGLFYYYNY